MTNTHRTARSKEEWLAARTELLVREKELTRLRDRLAEQRRHLPWLEVEKTYVFEGARGRMTLPDLFDGRSQLVVYHFMFGPDWEAGCKSCSFWADNFDRIVVHLAQRDVTFAVVSRAPLAKLRAFAERLGWSFEWVSSLGTDFNFDFGVSFSARQVAQGEIPYNYAMHRAHGTEMPGISVFVRDGETVFHTYSCYARGLDMMNTAYHYLDLVPRGRDEGDGPMAWLKLRDQYGA
jgi:predicted dithiol-disulfide oxidoreductase (DUF899 family)